MLIPRGVLELRKTAAQERTRYAMNGIRLARLADGRAQAVSTDGKRLVIVTWDDASDVQSYPETGVALGAQPGFVGILPLHAIEKALKHLPKKSPKPILTQLGVSEKAAGESLTLVSSDLESTSRLESRQVEGAFPPFEDALPKGEPVYRECISADYLVEIGEVLREAGGGNGDALVRLEFFGEGKAIRVTRRAGAGVQAEAVLMPISAGDWQGYQPLATPTVESGDDRYTGDDVTKLLTRIKSLEARERSLTADLGKALAERDAWIKTAGDLEHADLVTALDAAESQAPAPPPPPPPPASLYASAPDQTKRAA